MASDYARSRSLAPSLSPSVSCVLCLLRQSPLSSLDKCFLVEASPRIPIHGILTMINFRSQEFGEDAATAINELLGLYGYDDDNKRSELSVKFHRNSCKKIANISQKLLESKRQMRSSESESLRSKTNDYSSISSDKDSSRENSKSPLAMNITATEKDGMIFIGQWNVEAFERDVTQRFVVFVVDSPALFPFSPFDRPLSAANYLQSLPPVPLKADKSRE